MRLHQQGMTSNEQQQGEAKPVTAKLRSLQRKAQGAGLIGMTVWLHHQRGQRFSERLGGLLHPLLVTDRYPGTVVVKTPDGREHHLRSNPSPAWSLLNPADQLAYELERFGEEGSR